MSVRKPTVVDLFCGAGGMSHGFEQAGFMVLAGVDHDRDSLITFKANYPQSQTIEADLEEMTPRELGERLAIRPGEIDCLAGGPPCQGFSRNRAYRHQNGEFVDDPRNHLYWHFFSFVDYLRPKVVLLENVPEILIKSDGYFRDAVFEAFSRLGYRTEAKVVNAAEFGAPQHRRRAFFLAAREGEKIAFPASTTLPGPRAGRRTPHSADILEVKVSKQLSLSSSLFDSLPVGPTVWEAISDLYGEYAEGLQEACKYGTTPDSDYQRLRRNGATNIRNHFRWPLSERQLERIRQLSEGQGQLHLPAELQTKSGYGSAYRRLQSDAQALTITTWMFHPGSGMFTHPFDDRVITIREAARLQSFQDDFTFFGRYHSQCRQVGNAVAPLVARSLAQTVLQTIGTYSPAH